MRGGRGRLRTVVVTGIVGVLAVAGVSVVTGAAEGALTSGTAVFGPVQGTAAPFATTMQLPGLGYPVAEVTTDAYAATVPATRAAGWGPATPPGERFGSGLSRSYLSLRPAANDARSPSTTTYTFDGSPPTGWGLVVGDIDADQVTLSATRPDGSDATTAQLGFEGVFNACATTPRSTECAGAPLTDVPTWDAGTATVRGNAAADNSTGADAWFVPTVPLRTLTLTYRWRKGQPTFQTWFASRARTASGQVVLDGAAACDLTTATVSLLAADDSVLATTTPAADGSWSFPRVATTDAFTARLSEVPAGCRVTGADEHALDLTTADDDTTVFTLVPAVGPVPTASATVDPTGDPTVTPTAVPSATVTTSPSATATASTSATASPSATPAASPTASPTATVLATTAVAPTSTTGAAPLPDTGGPGRGLLVGGLALVLAGGAALVLARRRRG